MTPFKLSTKRIACRASESVSIRHLRSATNAKVSPLRREKAVRADARIGAACPPKDLHPTASMGIGLRNAERVGWGPNADFHKRQRDGDLHHIEEGKLALLPPPERLTLPDNLAMAAPIGNLFRGRAGGKRDRWGAKGAVQRLHRAFLIAKGKVHRIIRWFTRRHKASYGSHY